MKIKLITSFICGIIIALTPALRAQDATTSGTAPAGPGNPGHQFHPGERGGENPLERLSKALDLTEDQKAKIKPIIEERRQKMQALRDDTSLSKEQRMEQVKEIFKSSNEQIKALLTPDQQQKFEQLMQEMREHREQGNKAQGTPGQGTPAQGNQ